MGHRHGIAWALLIGGTLTLAGCKCCTEGGCLKKSGGDAQAQAAPSSPLSGTSSPAVGSAKQASPAISDMPAARQTSWNTSRPAAMPGDGARPLTASPTDTSAIMSSSGKPTPATMPHPGMGMESPPAALPMSRAEIERTTTSSPAVEPTRPTPPAMDAMSMPPARLAMPDSTPSMATKPMVNPDALRSEATPRMEPAAGTSANGDTVFTVPGATPPAMSAPTSEMPALPPLPADGK